MDVLYIITYSYIFVLFLSALCRPIGKAVIRQSMSLLHLFKFFVVRKAHCGFPLVLYLRVVGLEVTKASFYMLGISEAWVLELLTAPLKGFSLFAELSAVRKGTWVDLVDWYLLGMLRHSTSVWIAFLKLC